MYIFFLSALIFSRSCLNDCQKALKKDPEHLKVKVRAAQCYIKLKMFDEAIAYCDEMLENNPEDDNVLKIRKNAVMGQVSVENIEICAN